MPNIKKEKNILIKPTTGPVEIPSNHQHTNIRHHNHDNNNNSSQEPGLNRHNSGRMHGTSAPAQVGIQPSHKPSGGGSGTTTTMTTTTTNRSVATQQVNSSLSSIHSLHPQLDLKLNSRFMLMPINDQIRELQTVIRDKETTRGNFKFYADRLIRLVVEEGLNQLPTEDISVKTPTGHMFKGIRYLKGNCGVSIVRSGESMEQGLRDCCRSIRIGKILIESDENNQARVLYAKFPRDIADRKILLLYPIMSTGLAVIESVKVLLSYGVKEENLILLNLFSSPKAAKIINQKFPNMFVLTSDINHVCPNHFGHRYFGTD